MILRTLKTAAAAASFIAIGLSVSAVRFMPSETAPKKPVITVYKDPGCGCCKNWIQYLTKHGYTVDAKNARDMPAVKRMLGVPAPLAACHTAVVNGYLLEGHVSAEDIDRLLAQKPKIAGIAVPGMPVGSPGMAGPHAQRYQVLGFDKKGKITVFATH